jgi:hypothetical protein
VSPTGVRRSPNSTTTTTQLLALFAQASFVERQLYLERVALDVYRRVSEGLANLNGFVQLFSEGFRQNLCEGLAELSERVKVGHRLQIVQVPDLRHEFAHKALSVFELVAVLVSVSAVVVLVGRPPRGPLGKVIWFRLVSDVAGTTKLEAPSCPKDQPALFTLQLIGGHLVDLRDPSGRKIIYRERHVCLLCLRYIVPP